MTPRTSSRVRRSAAGVVLLAALALLVVACGRGDDGATATPEGGRGAAVAETASLSIHDPFIPAPPTDLAALYFDMVDLDGEGDRLLGVTTSAAAMTMLHFSTTDGDLSRMLPVEGGIVLPPSGATALEPGGLHVMLMALEAPLAEGDTVEVTLHFERSESVTFEAPVRALVETDVSN